MRLSLRLRALDFFMRPKWSTNDRLDEISARLARMEMLMGMLARASQRELERDIYMSKTLEETLAKVREEGDKVDSIIAYNAGLKQQIDEVLSGVTLPPHVQEKIDSIFEEAQENADKIDAALVANTTKPAEPA